MELEIEPEPTPEEREAIERALAEPDDAPPAAPTWDEDYAAEPPRSSRGATRA